MSDLNDLKCNPSSEHIRCKRCMGGFYVSEEIRKYAQRDGKVICPNCGTFSRVEPKRNNKCKSWDTKVLIKQGKDMPKPNRRTLTKIRDLELAFATTFKGFLVTAYDRHGMSFREIAESVQEQTGITFSQNTFRDYYLAEVGFCRSQAEAQTILHQPW